HVLGGDILIVLQRPGLHDHLEILEAGPVVQLDEAEGLHVPDGADPAAHGDRLAGECLAVGVDGRDFRIAHKLHPFSCFCWKWLHN
ncbi:HNH endonuclease, partial [Dysosmobacter welbionis]